MSTITKEEGTKDKALFINKGKKNYIEVLKRIIEKSVACY